MSSPCLLHSVFIVGAAGAAGLLLLPLLSLLLVTMLRPVVVPLLHLLPTRQLLYGQLLRLRLRRSPGFVCTDCLHLLLQHCLWLPLQLLLLSLLFLAGGGGSWSPGYFALCAVRCCAGTEGKKATLPALPC